MTDTFYRDLEAQFRGDPSHILSRLRVYQPFLTPLACQEGGAQALDLGCGRGEWLEILEEAGLSARGVDIDKAMLDVARDKGLAVESMEALTAIRALPDNTLALVSAFHLIEHLPFDEVRELVEEARRVLRPGGLLILETPNPENPLVGLVNFHLDPTHVRPLPPILTSFLTEHAGFSRNVVLRLQGSEPKDETAAHLISLLTDVSLDYAVVAQVDGPKIGDLDKAFALQLGMDLHHGLHRFDAALSARMSDIHQVLANQDKAITALRKELKQVAPLAAELPALRRKAQEQQKVLKELLNQSKRSILERLLFRPVSGRPKRALRRLLFHTNGKPRGMFRKWIVDGDGTPRRLFRQWMSSPDYLMLPWPANQHLGTVPEPEENILVFDPHRPRSTDLPAHVMTIEELVAKADDSTKRGT
ncbi:bifunctional 2-polyprenyl-6-hydroxyphenol methylase/3-demethylubiquinol 3-O-methyltransferase UbiG [Ruegeria sp. 6PALISEP08]|uniref:class I SAM-dependent methyltransferase n=1 Tax=Ruegeria sp. 6PALISEP08 TaxID=1225660 RepID=UPI00067E8658|nr:class I SAM-dependent methyltransferase [Ruegeria sp. 6PALISEP08]